MSQGKYFGLSTIQTEGGTKIGIIVSNKISKLSVERNRIRRIVRALCREFIQNNSSGLLMVFLAKKTSENAKSEDLSQDIERLLVKYAKNNS